MGRLTRASRLYERQQRADGGDVRAGRPNAIRRTHNRYDLLPSVSKPRANGAISRGGQMG